MAKKKRPLLFGWLVRHHPTGGPLYVAAREKSDGYPYAVYERRREALEFLSDVARENRQNFKIVRVTVAE